MARRPLMALAGQFKQEFDPSVRSRGAQYFHSGCVTIVEGKPGHLRARVRGTHLYTVELRYDRAGQVLSAECNCPYSSNYGDTCKHIYAALLAADDARVLTDVHPRAGFSL